MTLHEAKPVPHRSSVKGARKRARVGKKVVALLSLFVFTLGSAMAQGSASAPIRVIMPTASGGATDTVIRAMLSKMGPMLGTTLVVDNQPGAGSIVGTGAIGRALPDGTTIGVATSGALVANPHLKKKLPYDTANDFAPICRVGRGPYVLVVNPALGPKTLPELLARAKTESLAFASPGVGSSAHMAQELFKARTGSKFLHVPYKGTGQAITDTVGGQTQVLFEAPGPLLPQLRAGKLLPIAVTSGQRVSSLPNVPTFAELGYKGIVLEGWIGLMAPAAMPAPLVERMAKACEAAVKEPDVVAQAQQTGFEIDFAGPSAFRSFIASELGVWGEFVKLSGLTPE